MKSVLDRSCRENQNTRSKFKNVLFRKSRSLWHKVEKLFRHGQATDVNMAQAQCMLDT